jgi:hypothetical protein
MWAAACSLLLGHGCHQRSNESGTSAEELAGELAALYELMSDSVAERKGGVMVAWGQQMAQEHFEAGHQLHHAQSLVNVLESALWKRILADLDPQDYAEALGLARTALGLAKDSLARTYVSASKHKVEALDMRSLRAPPTPRRAEPAS